VRSWEVILAAGIGLILAALGHAALDAEPTVARLAALGAGLLVAGVAGRWLAGRGPPA
jgi:multisubunit Na+/H+ antiporter MnhB subunit